MISSPEPRRWSPASRALAIAIGVIGLIYLLYLIRAVAIPVMLGFALAYLLHPAIDGLTARKVPRWLAILLIFFMFLILVSMFLLFLIPAINTELRQFAARIPQYRLSLEERVLPWLAEVYEVETEEEVRAIFLEYLDSLRQSAPKAMPAVGNFLKTAFTGTLSFIFAVFSVMLIPVFAVYFAYDYQRIVERLKTLVPPRSRDNVFRIAGRVDRAVASFVRGQLTVVTILAAMYSVGLSLVGIELAVFIGVVAGFFNMVPYLGVFTGLILGLAMAFLNFTSWWKVIGVIAVFGVGNTIDAVLITPKIVGDRVGLRPVVVIIALLAFGQLFGFLGVLIAIPATAALAVLLTEAADWWRASPAFQEEAKPDDGGGDAEPPAS